MAIRDNLVSGDPVHWNRNGKLVEATVFGKTPKLIAIKIKSLGQAFVKYVHHDELIEITGGKREIEEVLAKKWEGYPRECPRSDSNGHPSRPQRIHDSSTKIEPYEDISHSKEVSQLLQHH